MRATNNNYNNQPPILIPQKQLQEYLGCGYHTSRKIAEAAHAIVRIGRRTLFNTKKIQQYLDEISVAE